MTSVYCCLLLQRACPNEKMAGYCVVGLGLRLGSDIEARVVEAHLEGDDLKVELSFETPKDYRNYAAPDGYGQYHLLEVEAFRGELKVGRVDER